MIGHIELAKCSFHNFQLNLTIYRRSETTFYRMPYKKIINEVNPKFYLELRLI